MYPIFLPSHLSSVRSSFRPIFLLSFSIPHPPTPLAHPYAYISSRPTIRRCNALNINTSLLVKVPDASESRRLSPRTTTRIPVSFFYLQITAISPILKHSYLLTLSLLYLNVAPPSKKKARRNVKKEADEPQNPKIEASAESEDEFASVISITSSA